MDPAHAIGPPDRRRVPRPARPDSVATRLRRPLQLFVVAAVVVTAAGVFSLAVADRALDRMVDEVDPLRSANRDVLDAILDADTELRGYRLTWDQGFLPDYRAAVARYPEAQARAQRLSRADDAVEGAVAEQDRIFRLWLEYAAEVQQLGESDRPAAERLVRTGRGRSLIDQVRTANDEAAVLIDDIDREIADENRTLGTLGGAVALAVLVAAAGLGVAANRRTRRSVVEPLERLHATIGRHRSGDRTARADVVGAEEVRAVSAAFNRLAAADAELSAQQEAQLVRERRVRELGRRIRATLDAEVVVRLTADALGPATGTDRVVIRPVADLALGAVETEWNHSPDAEAGGGPLDPHPDLLAHVYPDLAAGRTVLLEDTFDHPVLSDDALAVFTDAGWGSVAIVPVSEGGEVQSLIALEVRERSHRWSPDAIRLAEAMAAEMGLARHTARLFAQERAMVDRLREIDQAKSDFVSSVSHELRTPLTSIRGYVEMLQDGDGGEITSGQERMLAVVERNTDRLLALIEDLLTLSRIESGAFRTTLADVDLGALVRSAAEVVAIQARTAEVRLEVDVADDLPDVRGDAHQLERVLLNLLTNAIKFSEAGSTVALRACRDGDEARIEVADEGMGIPESEQARLFSRFFRASTAQDAAVPGTGLGLVIAKTAVDNHGGSIAVDSAAGEGTTFTVVLPGLPRMAVAR